MKTKIKTTRSFLVLFVSSLLASSAAIADSVEMFAPSQGDAAGRRSKVEGRGSDGSGVCNYAYHILKVAPSQAALGGEIKYQIILTNIGDCGLQDIKVSDLLPKGTEITGTNPAPARTWHKRLIWDKVNLQPGERAIFEVNVKAADPWKLPMELSSQGCASSPSIGKRVCDISVTSLQKN